MRSIHEYNAEFIRLAERNDLKESKGQRASRYLEGLKPQIRDKSGVHVMQKLHEAKNMALKAEFMLQDRGRYEPPRMDYGRENSKAPVDKRVIIREAQPRYDRFRKEKAAGKRKLVEAKEAPQPANLHSN